MSELDVRVQRSWAVGAWAVLVHVNADTSIFSELDESRIHRLENVMTMQLDMHRLYDKMTCWFEQTVRGAICTSASLMRSLGQGRKHLQGVFPERQHQAQTSLAGTQDHHLHHAERGAAPRPVAEIFGVARFVRQGRVCLGCGRIRALYPRPNRGHCYVSTFRGWIGHPCP